MTTTNFTPGNLIRLTYGPFQCTAIVMEVNDIGMVVAPLDDAKLVGYKFVQHAPNGTQLTRDPMHDFIGAAHFPHIEVIDG